MGWPGPMTHRQFLAWQQWLEDQWDNPSRTDQYLQSIACHVRRSQSLEPENVKFEHFRLTFNNKDQPPKDSRPLNPTTGLPMTDQQIARFHRAKAAASIGAFGVASLNVQPFNIDCD